VELEGSLPCSRQLTTEPYLKPHEYNLQSITSYSMGAGGYFLDGKAAGA
jgi:hypothetical protein